VRRKIERLDDVVEARVVEEREERNAEEVAIRRRTLDAVQCCAKPVVRRKFECFTKIDHECAALRLDVEIRFAVE
jgi:hypothetical protein